MNHDNGLHNPSYVFMVLARNVNDAGKDQDVFCLSKQASHHRAEVFDICSDQYKAFSYSIVQNLGVIGSPHLNIMYANCLNTCLV